MVKLLDGCSICMGHPDEENCELAKFCKGVFKDSSSKMVKASLDPTPFISTHRYYKEAICTTKCDILVSSGRSTHCKAYRPILRSLIKKAKSQSSPSRKATTSTVSWQYLSTPQRKERAKGRTKEVCCSNIMWITWAIIGDAEYTLSRMENCF